ncbi:MAG: alpha/beta fold hydrolase [Bacteroidota bacterium]
MRTVKTSFPNHAGLMLSASLDLPLGIHPKAYAIFAHCFTCGKNLRAERNISLALNQAGIGVLRFDFAGVGESEGEFYDTNFSTNVSDILSAADFLAQEYQAPSLLVGHSLGGAAVLLASKSIESVKAVATIGAPSQPAHVKHLFEAVEKRIQSEGEAQIRIGGKEVVIQKHFLEDIEGVDLQAEVHALRKALLVIHSPQDQIVGIENAKEIYIAAFHPKSFLTVDGADHLLSNKQDGLYVGNMIAAWAQRYVEFADPDPLETDKQAVLRLGASGFTTEVRAGNHTFLADEPKKVGGADLGPTPYDLLVSGLGACTAMTMRMYADRKGWDLKEVKVHLQHSHEYAEDAENAGKPQSKIDVISREIEISGALDDAQRARLMEIADRCPVHRTLHGEIRVDTVMK